MSTFLTLLRFTSQKRLILMSIMYCMQTVYTFCLLGCLRCKAQIIPLKLREDIRAWASVSTLYTALTMSDMNVKCGLNYVYLEQSSKKKERKKKPSNISKYYTWTNEYLYILHMFGFRLYQLHVDQFHLTDIKGIFIHFCNKYLLFKQTCSLPWNSLQNIMN